jgi:hypothetical protein
MKINSLRSVYSFSISLYLICLTMFSLLACGEAVIEDEETQPHAWDIIEQADGDGKADGVYSKFDPEWIVSDHFFNKSTAVTSEAIQSFFENSPYGRSWLADATFDGMPASRIIHDAAQEFQLNPIMLIARMQVEKSLVSATSKPRKSRIDFAMGCGCPDYQACSSRYQGFTNQIKCAAETMRLLYVDSENKATQWTAGKTARTLDGTYVTPANHATASLYAYTPWILRNRGGNWLVWNVSLKMYDYLAQMGALTSNEDGCVNATGRRFIGDPCACESDCGFWADGRASTCHVGGFCTIPCEGYCPDLSGRASTFCATDTISSLGVCASKSSSENGHCADLSKTVDTEIQRYIGNSGASSVKADVCLPLAE